MTPSREILISFFEVWLEHCSPIFSCSIPFPSRPKRAIFRLRSASTSNDSNCQQQLVHDSRSQPCYSRRTHQFTYIHHIYLVTLVKHPSVNRYPHFQNEVPTPRHCLSHSHGFSKTYCLPRC